MSKELKDYLHSRGIATGHSTPYHPTGNSQCERCNQIVWKTGSLILKGRNLGPHLWEPILPDALHAVRTLLCTATNASPHERFFPFSRRSMLGRSLPRWMITPGTGLLKKFVRNNSEPLCEEVDLLNTNPKSTLIRFQDGQETTVSASDLVPAGSRVDNPDSTRVLTIQPPMLNRQCPQYHRLNHPRTPKRSTCRLIPLLTARYYSKLKPEFYRTFSTCSPQNVFVGPVCAARPSY